MTVAMKRVLVVYGTRPEAIKLAPVVLALRRAGVPTFLLSTGQHREMLASVLGAFGLVPDRDLGVMRPDQSLAGLSARILQAADQVLTELEPSWVVVQGDTTIVAMMALAAFYRKLRVAHVEAGLRTGDRYDPFPEEMNRTLLAPLAALHFAPTERARENLLAEGVPAGAVQVVGNTVIDALRHVEARVRPEPFSRYGLPDPAGRHLVVVTGHRRESFGAGFEGVFAGLAELAGKLTGEVLIVYPVHLNPNVREPAHRLLAGLPDLALIEPLAYEPFVKLLTSARLIVTGSSDAWFVEYRSQCGSASMQAPSRFRGADCSSMRHPGGAGVCSVSISCARGTWQRRGAVSRRPSRVTRTTCGSRTHWICSTRSRTIVKFDRIASSSC